MKNLLGIAAILCGGIGMLSGISDWALSNFILDDADWDGPMGSVQIFAWFLSYVGFGLGIICLALMNMVRSV